jgi:hypothetical protein
MELNLVQDKEVMIYVSTKMVSTGLLTAKDHPMYLFGSCKDSLLPNIKHSSVNRVKMLVL